MTIHELKVLVENNSESKNEEFERLFHGRGGTYKGLEALTIDSIDSVLYVALFAPFDQEEALKVMLTELYESKKWEAVIIQKRFERDTPTEVFLGELPETSQATENGIKFKLNHLANQNNGFFPDMKVGRSYVKEHAKGKNILNLFSYTCGFSLAAMSGEAKKVVNVDMSKSVLNTGRENHRINGFDTRSVQFMPYNILKSWSRIKKAGPYDMIIIDPPSFQRGSFEATKDYQKIIKRLTELANETCTVLSCLNSPELDTQFIKDIFEELSPEFVFEKRLDNLDSFPAIDEECSLKNLIFKRNV
jgi:23S rRNA (cytosine1962-C5)-methyltransferase